MSIKVLADKVLAFDRGEKNRDGILITIRTKIGFNELPDWVAETDYFKAAQADGSLKAFTSSADSETVLKEQERLAALKDEIKAAEEKLDLLNKATADLSTGASADPAGTTPDAPADATAKTKTK